VILIENDGERWLVSPYGMVAWVHNVRAQPEVTLRQGKRTETLHAEEVDPETAGPVLQRYVRKVRVTTPFFDAKGNDPMDKFIEDAPPTSGVQAHRRRRSLTVPLRRECVTRRHHRDGRMPHILRWC
jgi:hypothetical protein